MEEYRVMDLMVPLSEYATVPMQATMYDAMLALEKAQAEFDHTKYRHRAVLILNEDNQVVGKLSQLDVLRALEPQDDSEFPDQVLGNFGFSNTFIHGVARTKRLLGIPLKETLGTACRSPVETFMQRTTEGEYVDESTSLEMAIHQIVSGNHLALLVTRGKNIIGVLRLADVFAAVFHAMKESEPPRVSPIA